MCDLPTSRCPPVWILPQLLILRSAQRQGKALGPKLPCAHSSSVSYRSAQGAAPLAAFPAGSQQLLGRAFRPLRILRTSFSAGSFPSARQMLVCVWGQRGGGRDGHPFENGVCKRTDPKRTPAPFSYRGEPGRSPKEWTPRTRS